jgi:putative sterol carrier protein
VNYFASLRLLRLCTLSRSSPLLDAFSQDWALAWARALNESDEYRSAAATWEGAVGLLLDDAEPAKRRAVLLDLWHGACRSAQIADPDNLDSATFVFRGNRAAWRQILTDGGSPVMALLSGRIRLAKGELSALLPYANAARELLGLAGSVPTRFCEG